MKFVYEVLCGFIDFEDFLNFKKSVILVWITVKYFWHTILRVINLHQIINIIFCSNFCITFLEVLHYSCTFYQQKICIFINAKHFQQKYMILHKCMREWEACYKHFKKS